MPTTGPRAGRDGAAGGPGPSTTLTGATRSGTNPPPPRPGAATPEATRCRPHLVDGGSERVRATRCQPRGWPPPAESWPGSADAAPAKELSPPASVASPSWSPRGSPTRRSLRRVHHPRDGGDRAPADLQQGRHPLTSPPPPLARRGARPIEAIRPGSVHQLTPEVSFPCSPRRETPPNRTVSVRRGTYTSRTSSDGCSPDEGCRTIPE